MINREQRLMQLREKMTNEFNADMKKAERELEQKLIIYEAAPDVEDYRHYIYFSGLYNTPVHLKFENQSYSKKKELTFKTIADFLKRFPPVDVFSMRDSCLSIVPAYYYYECSDAWELWQEECLTNPDAPMGKYVRHYNDSSKGNLGKVILELLLGASLDSGVYQRDLSFKWWTQIAGINVKIEFCFGFDKLSNSKAWLSRHGNKQIAGWEWDIDEELMVGSFMIKWAEINKLSTRRAFYWPEMAQEGIDKLVNYLLKVSEDEKKVK